MHIRVIAIDQRLALGTQGAMQNFLVLELPGGKEARAAIDLETTRQLIQIDAEQEDDGLSSVGHKAEETIGWHEGATPPVASSEIRMTGLQPAPRMDSPVVAEAPEAETVDWGKLSDEILSPAMKAAFLHLKIPSRLTPAQVRSIEEEVMGKFGDDEWEEVLGPLAASMAPKAQVAAPAAPSPPQPAPPLGQVQWADGAPMLANTRPSRTVPKTSMGYPIPQNGTIDPGEMVGGEDPDEDGVGQL